VSVALGSTALLRLYQGCFHLTGLISAPPEVRVSVWLLSGLFCIQVDSFFFFGTCRGSTRGAHRSDALPPPPAQNARNDVGYFQLL